MAPRWPLEADFELFRTLVAKWLPDGLWRRILSSSGLIVHKYSGICVFRTRASGFLPLAADWPTCRLCQNTMRFACLNRELPYFSGWLDGGWFPCKLGTLEQKLHCFCKGHLFRVQSFTLMFQMCSKLHTK